MDYHWGVLALIVFVIAIVLVVALVPANANRKKPAAPSGESSNNDPTNEPEEDKVHEVDLSPPAPIEEPLENEDALFDYEQPELSLVDRQQSLAADADEEKLVDAYIVMVNGNQILPNLGSAWGDELLDHTIFYSSGKFVYKSMKELYPSSQHVLCKTLTHPAQAYSSAMIRKDLLMPALKKWVFLVNPMHYDSEMDEDDLYKMMETLRAAIFTIYNLDPNEGIVPIEESKVFGADLKKHSKLVKLRKEWTGDDISGDSVMEFFDTDLFAIQHNQLNLRTAKEYKKMFKRMKKDKCDYFNMLLPYLFTSEFQKTLGFIH